MLIFAFSCKAYLRFQGRDTASGLLEHRQECLSRKGKDKLSWILLGRFLGCVEIRISKIAQFRGEQRTMFCLNLIVIPSPANISLNNSLTHALNCSLVARVDTPINNALCALYIFFVLSCESTGFSTNVYWCNTLFYTERAAFFPLTVWS